MNVMVVVQMLLVAVHVTMDCLLVKTVQVYVLTYYRVT